MTQTQPQAGCASPDPVDGRRRAFAEAASEKVALRAILAAHQAPVLRRSLGQLATTFLPFFAVIAAMYLLRGVSVWLTLALSLPAAGLVVRIFIIQHDCGHGAFFRNRTANEWLGRFCGLITLTPYANWRRHHSNHHAVWNNLDRRNSGADIYSTCLTVAEYRTLTPLGRWWHRAVRHPLVAQVLLPPLVFVLLHRVPFDTPLAWRREWASVLLTDLGIVGVVTALILLLGTGPVVLVQLPTISIAAICGVWIFSVQHCFEQSLWAREDEWNVAGASLLGTSYLKLPGILRWFSSNIGYHHMHHLMPRVPNYRLADCHHACAAVAARPVPPITLWQALRASGYALWDEELHRMVRFADVGRTPRAV
jgi:omega-6 fatty acid desaturase (delta-12 desaturase)